MNKKELEKIDKMNDEEFAKLCPRKQTDYALIQFNLLEKAKRSLRRWNTIGLLAGITGIVAIPITSENPEFFIEKSKELKKALLNTFSANATKIDTLNELMSNPKQRKDKTTINTPFPNKVK